MGKHLPEYKLKIISFAIQHSKDVVALTADKLAEKVRSRVEFTGLAERDVSNVLAAIKAIASEMHASYL